MPDTTENERREKAFLALIRYAEFNQQERPDAYYTRNGNDHFADMSRHPGPRPAGSRKSSASGAYQITYETYLRLVKAGGPTDFSAASQDRLALLELDQAGVLPLIWDGHLHGAYSLLNRIWNSLPGGGKHLISEKEADEYFWSKVGENVPSSGVLALPRGYDAKRNRNALNLSPAHENG